MHPDDTEELWAKGQSNDPATQQALDVALASLMAWVQDELRPYKMRVHFADSKISIKRLE